MGVFDVLKTVVGAADTLSSINKVMGGKIDAASLISILSAYLKNQGSAASTAKTEATSMVDVIMSAVNLKSVSSIGELVGKLQSSGKPGTADIANTLATAINVVKALNQKA